VNRSQLLNALAERNEMSRREADEVVSSLVDIITETAGPLARSPSFSALQSRLSARTSPDTRCRDRTPTSEPPSYGGADDQ